MTDSHTKPPLKGISLQRVGSRWAKREDIQWFQMWLQFLRLSPSYELARKCRAGELNGSEALPADFDTVLAVYDDLGDVIVPRFVDWWREVGISHFGFEGEKPSPSLLGTIQHGGDNDLGPAMRGYMSKSWPEQGEPKAIIAAIPVGLTKAQIAKWIDATFTEYGGEAVTPAAPSYELTGRKLRRRSVWQYMRCLLTKAANPDMTLWQIGAKVKLSTTYSDQEARSQQRTYDKAIDHKNLKEMTSRALNRGQMLAENAARGIFPSYTKCPTAMPFDWAETHQRSVMARKIERASRAA